MEEQHHFMDDFRRFFVRGLAALVPTLLTLAIIIWAYQFLRDSVGGPLTEGLFTICTWVSPEPAPGLVDPYNDALRYGDRIDEWNDRGEQLTRQHIRIHHPALHDQNEEVRNEAEAHRRQALWRIAFAKYKLHLLGFLIAIVLVYFVGFFLASFMGRAVWRGTERLLCRIPLIRAVYPNVKQVTDFLLSERRVEFSGVVAVQYPRKGLWSVGLSTGAPMRLVQAASEDELVTVFIPSSPTPVTGYVIQVPRQDVLELPLSIDEGLRFTISGGVIKPSAFQEFKGKHAGEKDDVEKS